MLVLDEVVERGDAPQTTAAALLVAALLELISLTGSEAGPTLTFARRSPGRLRSPSAIPPCTRRRLPAMQNWPAKTVRAFSIFGRAASRSASSKTMSGVLPPQFKVEPLQAGSAGLGDRPPRPRAARKADCRNVGGFHQIAQHFALAGDQILMTPGGRLFASLITSLTSAFTWAVCPGILRRQCSQLPAPARASG